MPPQKFWRDYTFYLQSEEWQYLRKLVMQRAGGVCELCHSRRACHVHHLTYDHVFNERLYELQAVCLPCHDAIHHGKLTDSF
jgi:5-methylcytosine-specific restriction endonuclease McrA